MPRKLAPESVRRRRVKRGVAADRRRFKGTKSESVASDSAYNIQVRQEAERSGGVKRRRGA